jgi:hypothetical protein
MNPWFGLIAGPALAALGVAVVRDPSRFLRFSDAGFRLAYHLADRAYEGSRAHRLALGIARIGGMIAILVGASLFIAGIVLLVDP